MPLRSATSVLLAAALMVTAGCEQMPSEPPKAQTTAGDAARAKAAADAAATAAKVAEAKQIAEEAYIYGYALITSEVTRVQMTNVPKLEGLRMPMGQMINVPRYPPANYRGISAPNADTLYSVAWLDLGKEPMVFSHPDMGKRYFLFPVYSLWMPVVDSPGTRTTGQKAATFLVTGPGWNGEVPKGMSQIKAPTRFVILLGRTYADGTERDYKAVNALQAQYKLVPLSAYGKPYKFEAPPVDPNPGFSMTDKPQQAIDALDVSAYFNLMAKLMGGAAPPAPEDAPMVAKMAKIGLEPGKPFDLGKLDPAVQAALKDVPRQASAKIFAGKDRMGTPVNNWQVPTVGVFGTDYMNRAIWAAFGWPGGNLPQDAVYPSTLVDSEGKTLNGSNKYTLTFKKGEAPPVDGFWSITMYIIDGGWWFYPNPLNKFTVSMRDKPKFNADGSLTLHFQHESPGRAKEPNWLPAPPGEFVLMMRMYWPREKPPSVLPPGKGTWQPPPVVKAS